MKVLFLQTIISQECTQGVERVESETTMRSNQLKVLPDEGSSYVELKSLCRAGVSVGEDCHSPYLNILNSVSYAPFPRCSSCSCL